MTDARLPLAELPEKAGEGDLLRAAAEAVLQLLMGADVEGPVGAGRRERSPDRLDYRNGYRERTPDTRLGSLQLRVPKLRQGSLGPPPRPKSRHPSSPGRWARGRAGRGRPGGWIGGASTRRVGGLVQATGLAGIGKSTASKPCREIGERMNASLERPLEGKRPHLWLGATHPKVRDGGRIVPPAATIAVAVDAKGRREIVGLGLGLSEAEPFWSAFLKGLVRRGPRGVKPVASDAHEGLPQARDRRGAGRARLGSAAGRAG